MKKATGLPKHQAKQLKALVGKRFIYDSQEFTLIQWDDNLGKKEIEITTHFLVFRFKYHEVEYFLDSIIKVTTINNAKETETGNDHPQDRTED